MAEQVRRRASPDRGAARTGPAHRPGVGPPAPGAARRELGLVLLVAVACSLLAHRLDAGTRFRVDPLVVGALCTGLATALYAWRRCRDSALMGRLRAHAELALAQTSEQYRSFYAYHPHGVAVLDVDGRVLAANEAASAITGHSEEQLRALGFQDLVVAADLPGVSEAFAAALAREPQALEASIRHRDGQRVPVRLTGLPSLVGDQVVGVCVVAEDITERHLLETELRLARRVAEDANAAKSVFLANISHQMRTPLTTVLGYAELLGETRLDPLQRRFLDAMQGPGAQLLRLVDDLLDFGRIEAGGVRLELAPFDLGLVVAHTVAPHARDARAKGIDLAWLLDPDLPRQVVGDADRVAQVLANLVDNAVKFTDGGWVRISARTTSTPDHVLLVVRDSGTGIGEDDQARLLQPLSRADGTLARRPRATGLGLAIAGELVSLMGGRLSVRSVPGLGSTFTVLLPLLAAPCDGTGGGRQQLHHPLP